MKLHKIHKLITEKPKLEDYQSDCFLLQCPYCGFNYTHQESPIPAPGEKWRSPRDTETFLASEHRQGGIAIPFTCEGCEIGSKLGFFLVISQHKGNTWVQVAKVRTDKGEVNE